MGGVSDDVQNNAQKNMSHTLIAIANQASKENIAWVFQGIDVITVTTGKINELVWKSHKPFKTYQEIKDISSTFATILKLKYKMMKKK